MWATVLHVWLLLFRKDGWDDLDAVQVEVAALRRDQYDHEPQFLQDAAARNDATPAGELTDGHHDVGEQLDAQFGRAGATAAYGGLVRQEVLRLLAGTAHSLVEAPSGGLA